MADLGEGHLADYRPLTVDMGPRVPPSLKSLICPWGGVVMEWVVGARFMQVGFRHCYKDTEILCCNADNRLNIVKLFA